ncbi:P-selectin-like [Mustelus asterias]
MMKKLNQQSPLVQKGGSQLWFFTIIVLELMFLGRIHGWTYKYINEDMIWDNARQFCQRHYTDLVAIQNAEEIEHLNKFIPFAKYYYWIGIRKMNGIWTWVGTNKPLTKEAENWARNEPNNVGADGNEDCVEMYIKRQNDTGKWNDINCNKKKRPLCYIASCTPTSCSGHGECVENIGSYTCACNAGYYGQECEHVEQCATLNVPEQATMSCVHPNGNFSFDSRCEFQCAAGFTLQGSQSLRCNATGMWTADTPSCEVVRCGDLEIPQGFKNCSHPIGDFSYNSTCDFSCADGFELRGSERLECGASGEWSAPVPSCEAVKCESLMIPGQGRMDCSHPIGDFSYSSTCDFNCADGFELRGSERLECGASGEWSAPVPSCEAIKCEALEISNPGSKNCSHPIGDFSYNSTCDFSCADGFELRGSERLQCGASGEWSAPVPSCEAVKCESLMIPGQGRMDCSHPIGDFSYNSTCDFNCADGFELRGSERLECGASGEWSAPVPSCEAIKCEALEISNPGSKNCSHPIGDFSYNSTCDFSCADGFELRGSERLECGASGEWSAPVPSCEAVKCESLMIPGQGRMDCSHPIGDFSYNSTCDFNCADGFVLRGSERLECGASGEWSAPVPSCEVVQCKKLESRDQVIVTCSKPIAPFSHNSTCDFSCPEGFVLSGSSSVKCEATGQWTTPMPACKAVKCDVPESPRNGNMNCSHPIGTFSYLSACDFGCVEGFSLNGSVSLQCEESGMWSSLVPVCQELLPENYSPVLTVTAVASGISAMTLIGWIVRQLRKKTQAKKFSLLRNESQDKISGTYKANDEQSDNMCASCTETHERQKHSQPHFWLLVAIYELAVWEGVYSWNYSFSTNDMMWPDARNYCQTSSTDLVAIQNREENNYLNVILPKNPTYYWIGIRKIHSVWTWIGTKEPLTQEAENWAKGEPTSGSEDCVEIYIKRDKDEGMWNNDPCGKKKRAICYLASCKPTSCSGRGECVETIGNYTCRCDEGFCGPECEFVEQCATLNVPEQATMSCVHPNGNFSFDSRCEFQCAAGFTLQGSQSLRCSATGMWTAETPNCEATTCGSLETPREGFMNCKHPFGHFSYSSSCDFSCDEGFELHGSVRLQCGASRRWIGQKPNCEVVQCGRLQRLGNELMNCTHPFGEFSYNSTCHFSCTEGSELSGPGMLACGASGNWTAQQPTCEVVQCGRLQRLGNELMNCTHPFGEFSYNSTCHFSCTEGSELSGPGMLACGASGNWTAQQPTCEVLASDRMWKPHKSPGVITVTLLALLLLSFIIWAIIRHQRKAKQEKLPVASNEENMETTAV